MGRFEKAKLRIMSLPKDYTYDEAKYLLQKLGFLESTKGKTSGSRIKFYRPSDNRMILLHKPHPKNTMSPGAVEDLLKRLEEYGELK